jgi:hypothetical protein
MYSEYSLLIFYLIISLAVISLLFFGSLFLVYQQPLVEKILLMNVDLMHF